VILADTSAWVEYDRSTGSAAEERLIAADGPVAVTEPVVMEVLAGARSDKREDDLRRLPLRFALVHFDAAADSDGAVRIYRRCRRADVTPRGSSRLAPSWRRTWTDAHRGCRPSSSPHPGSGWPAWLGTRHVTPRREQHARAADLAACRNHIGPARMHSNG
jgi:predicted nucleic acid-binding protein